MMLNAVFPLFQLLDDAAAGLLLGRLLLALLGGLRCSAAHNLCMVCEKPASSASSLR
jgi:hypothetical protein